MIPANNGEIIERVEAEGIETVRFLFVDQHGILRGKAITRSGLKSALENGIRVPSSLLLKDTSHRTVFPVWRKDAGFGDGVMTGAGDIVLKADPATFRALPWSQKSSSVLCDVYETSGEPVAFSSRHLLRQAIERLGRSGLAMTCGFEAEFHIYRLIHDGISHGETGIPGKPPQTRLIAQGYQLLTDTHYSIYEDTLDTLRQNASALGIEVRSMEIEFGPGQVEMTFAPGPPLEIADQMIMFRTMARQVCEQYGLLASFMCKPKLENAAANGWHLHQSLTDNTGNIFMPDENGAVFEKADQWIAGLLTHAAESTIFSTPTVNGYKRYGPYQLAPDRIQWGHDNKGTMIRALMTPGDKSSRIENRVAESGVNPHLFLTAQIHAGLAGIEGRYELPPPSDAPYDSDAPQLPASMIAAIEAFENSSLYRACLGEDVCRYFSRLKRAEWQRYLMTVSEWEQAEYFGLF